MSLRDRARKAAEQEAAQAATAQQQAQQELEERKRQLYASLAPKAVAKAHEILGEETDPAAWKLVHKHHPRYDGENPAWDSLWVETILEGVTVRYGYSTPYDKLRGYVGQRNVEINSLADFNTAMDWANPPPPPRSSLRQRLRDFLE